MMNNPFSNRGDSLSPAERLVRPFQILARNPVSGALLLLIAAVAALAWSNSPWSPLYFRILETPIRFSVGSFELSKPLLLWINESLMGVFFFVIGLEIKREVLAGELSSRRKAALPAFAALGGMVVPALVFILIAGSGEAAKGWGIPIATDIVFALGVLLLLGSRVPLGLKVLLTALAVVDDVGAILVIAFSYSGGVSLDGLLAGGLLLAVSATANLAGVRSSLVYFFIGLGAWFAFAESGVHATLAAVLMAFTIPARTRIEGVNFIERITRLIDALGSGGVPTGTKLLTSEQQAILHGIDHSVKDATAPLQQLEHALLPVATFVVLPLFALANAGVALGENTADLLFSPLSMGVVAGLSIGKQLGITLFSWLAVKFGLAELPAQVTWRQVHAVSVLGGIGFTMSLLIGDLAYTESELHDTARIGVLVGSTLSGLVGWALLSRSFKTGPARKA